MGKGLAAFALLASCSFPHADPNIGPRDGSVIDAPDARVIDARMIDAPDAPVIDAAIDAPPAIDTDGDGVVDTADNCPAMANPNQRDHDSDGLGDVCDKCPHLADPADPDGDMDGVGNACDPRPTTAGDSRAFWEGFYDTNAIGNWTVDGGTWAVANGVVTQSASNASFSTNALVLPVNLPRAAVTAGAHVIQLGNNTTSFDTPHVSVASGVVQNQSYWCSVVDEDNDDKLYATIVRPAMAPQYPSTDWTGTFAANSELRITSALIGTSNVCTAVQGTISDSISGTTGSTAGAVQLATRTASASFDYVFVVSIGN